MNILMILTFYIAFNLHSEKLASKKFGYLACDR